MNSNNKTDVFRKIVAAMSDEALSDLIERLSYSMPTTQEEDTKIVIPDDILKQYKDLKALLSRQPRLSNIDTEQRRWLRTIEQLKTLCVQRPDFYKAMTDVLIYHRLKQVCTKNLLPNDMIEKILPSLMCFIHTGQMDRPILFVGTQGCGKTTAAKIIIEAVLGLPAFICSASDSYGRGLSGKSITWRGATYGWILDACIRSNSLNPGIVIDEIDKTVHDPTEPSVDNILLSICDDRRELEENFLGMSIPTRHMPIFLTGNEVDRISDPLLDRCMVYMYPDAEVDQIFSICKNYCAQLMKKNNYAERVILDESILYEGIKRLYLCEHSIRQHKNMVETVLGRANINSLENGGKTVQVSLKSFEEVVAKGEGRQLRKIGFS